MLSLAETQGVDTGPKQVRSLAVGDVLYTYYPIRLFLRPLLLFWNGLIVPHGS